MGGWVVWTLSLRIAARGWTRACPVGWDPRLYGQRTEPRTLRLNVEWARKGECTMRLEAIERPTHPMVRMAYRKLRRDFGKVATPLKVLYARKPRLLPILMLMDRTASHGISLEPELTFLVLNFVDTQNECSFCHDYRQAQVVQRRMGLERFVALSSFRASDLFTARERAALAFAEEAVDLEVADETFGELQRHFTDTEIVELVWLVAYETYCNMMKRALGIGPDGLRELAEERVVQEAVTANH